MLEVYALTARTRKPPPNLVNRSVLSPLPVRERMKVRVLIQRTARFRILLSCLPSLKTGMTQHLIGAILELSISHLVEKNKMKSARIEQAKGPFKIVDEKILEPSRRQVRIKVQACGVCHSDLFTKEGAWPGITYPRSPGHEIAGVIEALGEDAGDWKVGDRVGVGWHGGNCFKCDPCRRGNFVDCRFLQVPGIAYDGGYAPT